MKTLKFSIILPVIFLFEISAQATTINTENTDPKSGIYLTASDYRNNHLHLSDDRVTKNKFRLNEFFGGKTLILNHRGADYQFSKDSIYGYRGNDGRDYRFYKSYSEKYKILENRRIVIYERQQPGNKQTGFKPVISYYFSNGADGEVYLLSLDNLKNVFRDQPAFDIIDANFQTDYDLAVYDKYYQTFRINRLLAKL